VATGTAYDKFSKEVTETPDEPTEKFYI
jgi:hypothetical protein